MKLYHSTTRSILGDFKIKGNCGYGAYFAKSKKASKTFGYITYKCTIKPKNTLVFNDNEVKGQGFFNMSKNQYDHFRSLGIDSLRWNRNGVFMEFVVLDPNIIISRELDY